MFHTKWICSCLPGIHILQQFRYHGVRFKLQHVGIGMVLNHSACPLHKTVNLQKCEMINKAGFSLLQRQALGQCTIPVST